MEEWSESSCGVLEARGKPGRPLGDPGNGSVMFISL